MAHEPCIPGLPGISDRVYKIQTEVTPGLDTANPTQVSEQAPSQPDPTADSGPAQSTEKTLNGDEAKADLQTEQPATAAEPESRKEDDGKKDTEGATATEHAGDTTKEGEPAQVGEKRAHPEEATNDKGDGVEGADGTEAKKLKTDESKPAEEETKTAKGKGGGRKSTRKTTVAATAKSANTEGKKRSVGRPRKHPAPEKGAEEKAEPEAGEKMDTAQPVAEQIN